MLEFARTHPGFTPAGTFYVNRDPFALGADAARGLRWLTQNGFELGNHTYDHADLSDLDDVGVQSELVRGAQVIEEAVPGYVIRTMALPFGSIPANASLAVRGSSGGTSYGPYGVMLVGANPSPSPYSTEFDAHAIPRIRTAQLPWRGLQENYAFDYWLNQLEANPESVYVSDGDASRISFPEPESSKLAPRFEGRANPY
jgi:peptidoglycan/xylan/chitin deacetylase (PgdA/CDA1 family)